MLRNNIRLSTNEIAAFLSGHRIHAFEPDTQMSLAIINYNVDGQCFATFVICTNWNTENFQPLMRNVHYGTFWLSFHISDKVPSLCILNRSGKVRGSTKSRLSPVAFRTTTQNVAR